MERHPVPPPAREVEETVAYLRTLLAGERGAGGFKLASPPAEPVPIVLAALRDRMLGLAARIADGAFTNFLPLSRSAKVAEAFGVPEKELACRFFSIHGPEAEALATAKRIFVAYATVPVYAEFFRWLGFGDEIEPVVARGTRAIASMRSSSLRRRSSARSFCSAPWRHSASALQSLGAGIDTAVLALSARPRSFPGSSTPSRRTRAYPRAARRRGS